MKKDGLHAWSRSGPSGRQLSGSGRRLACLLVIAALGMVTCSAALAKGGTSGRVVTFAEQPSAAPNYIMPLISAPYDNIANLLQFSNFLYTPIYWFGKGGAEAVNTSMSVAEQPVFSSNNTVVTITLKHWRWSNGEPITARDVIFWLNLLSAVTDPNAPAIGTANEPGPGYGDEVPGGLPQNIVSYAQTGTYTLVLHLNASYNPTWYLNNNLYELYAIPQESWDKTSSSGSIGNYDASAETRIALPNTSPAWYVPANPGTATSGALGVAQFLNSQSQDVTTYDTNPLWRVADGPFLLSQFTSEGFAKFVPNPDYSGSPKPSIGAFEELPFTSDAAELNALRSGTVSIGYLPEDDLPEKGSIERSEGYKLAPWNTWSVEYGVYNYTNPTVGAILKQLYFRQAFQSLVNQPQYIKDFFGGYGTATKGPVPAYPTNDPAISALAQKGLYTYDPGEAVRLLKTNGWTVVPGGSSYCSKPGGATGDCGAGISSNEPASLTMLYLSGSTPITSEMEALQSTLKRAAGIDLTLKSEPMAQVLGAVYDGCAPATPCSGWELALWAANAAWIYPASPTGENIFKTNASANAGYYSNPTADADILATDTAATASEELSAIHKYENFMIQQPPEIWLPNGPYQLTMYKSSIKGVVPQQDTVCLAPNAFTIAS